MGTVGARETQRGGDSFGLSSSSADLQVMAVWAHSGLLGSITWQVSSVRWSMTVDDAPGSICRSGHRNLAGGEGTAFLEADMVTGPCSHRLWLASIFRAFLQL